jgi:hypothetical protein
VSYALVGARVLIGLVFAVSGFAKLRGRGAFRASVAGLRLLPEPLVGPVAAAVVAAELAIPVLLLTPGAAAFGFAVAVLLLVAFSVGIARVLAAGTAASCRCFGVSAAPFGRHHLYRNGVLALVAAVGLLALAGPSGAGTELAGAAIAAGAASVAALVVVMLDDIVDLFRSPATR